MRINTCGSKEKPCILLLHTMFTTGRLFEALIPALAQDYFLVIPTLDGYDPDEKTEYPGTGEELERVEACLKEKQVRELAAAAGSSLGAMLAWGLWQRRRLPIRRLVLDSPPFGWSAVQAAENTKSFWQLVQAVQAAPEAPNVFDAHYGEFGAEMRHSCRSLTRGTIRRSCETCFGPQLPRHIPGGGTKIILVYGGEDSNYQHRKKDLENRPDFSLVVKPGFGHCGFLMQSPLEFAKLLKEE